MYELFIIEFFIWFLNGDIVEVFVFLMYLVLKGVSVKLIIFKVVLKIELENVSFVYFNSKFLFDNLNINI